MPRRYQNNDPGSGSLPGKRSIRQQELPFPEAWETPPDVVGLLTPDDIYARAEQMIDRLKEDKRIERKPQGIHAKALGPYFSMWANTSPQGGLIVVGLSNSGEVQGCESIPVERINDLENAGYVYAPEAIYEHRRVAVTNTSGEQDWVLLFRVRYHETRAVETTDRRIFVRRGESCVELKEDEERRQLRMDKGEVRFEQELCEGVTFPDDFDRPLLHQLLANVRRIRQIDESVPDHKLLAALRLGKASDGKFTPNVACVLLLASDPVSIVPGCKIHFLKFEGIEERHGPQYNEVANLPPIEGPIPRQIDSVNQLLEQRIRRFSGFGSDGRFQTTPEYPAAAWAEAIVNACVHRSYNYRNMKTFVRMFDDRLEIESPGPFPPGVSAATIYDIQHSRNPYMMEAMRYLGYVKEVGEGTPRIREEMRRLNLPEPEFSQQEINHTVVRVVLRNAINLRQRWVDADVAKLLGQQIVSKLNEIEKVVVNYAIVEGSINVSETMRLTDHNWPTSKKLLDGLVGKNVLVYVRKGGGDVDRKAHYVLAGTKPA